ncbi:hypothetical protein [Alistipes indistinctus]|uniref:DUF4906 domain-containing protein n=1 Tax=Alistipes indistinctus TaxID=626932 RepID=UPI003A869D66
MKHRIRPLLTLLLAGALGLVSGSCSKDPLADVPGGGSEGTGRTITATFDLTRDFQVGVDVKADGLEDVTTIKNLWVIQMAQDGSKLLQEPLYFTRVTFVEGRDWQVKFDLLEAPSKVVFVANTHDAAAYSELTLASTEADVAAVAREIATEADLTYNAVPMCGMWSGTPVIAVPGKVSMSSAASFVVFNLGANLPQGDSFEVATVQVRQVPAKMHYYRDDAGLNVYPYPELTADQMFDYPKELADNQQFAGGGISPDKLTFMWYLPENARGMGTASDQFRKTAETAPAGQADYCTYVEVYGRYFDASEPAGKQYLVTTYRLYLGANNKTDFNLLRNHEYTVNATLRGRNEVDMRVESVLNPANCYMVSEPSHEYTFNATIQGNGVLTPAPTRGSSMKITIVPDRMSPDGAMLLWETGEAGDVIEPGSVKLSDDKRYISFRTSATIGGNAVIAAMKNGQVIWSWHIWSTKYDPETSYDTYVTRTIDKPNYSSIPSREVRMMKVNLGATSLTSTPGDIGCYGLYYQWGRKDPFIGRASIGTANESTAFQDQTAKTTNAPGYEWKVGGYPAVATAITAPTTFINSNNSIGDWLTTAQYTGYDNLWGNPHEAMTNNLNPGPGFKSIYDPCPAGWRVPRADTWTMFTVSGVGVTRPEDINVTDFWEGGWYFYCTDTGSGPTAFYPAAGTRDWGTGKLYYTLVYGLCWSSSPNNFKASGVILGETMADPIRPFHGLSGNRFRYFENRASGNSVRCAREE